MNKITLKIDCNNKSPYRSDSKHNMFSVRPDQNNDQFKI